MGFLGRTPARPCTADLTTAVAALVLCLSPWLDPAERLGNFQDKITQQAPSRKLPRSFLLQHIIAGGVHTGFIGTVHPVMKIC